MNIFGENSGSEEDSSYRKNKKPFRRPIILKGFSGDERQRREEKWHTASSIGDSLKFKYKECYACKMPIYKEIGDIVELPDKDFHQACFVCCKCTRSLSGDSYRELNGNFYCEMDYKETFLPKCHVCTKYIHEVPVKFLQRNYHPLCFTCKKCSQVACPFSYKEKNGAVYDEECFHRLFSPKCFNCNLPIKDQKEMTVALGTTFHRDHFVCFECALPLPANNFRQKDGELYCEKDYHKLFTTKCDFCHDPIIHRGIKALGKNWHASCCLRCGKCQKILEEGKYFEEAGQAYCRHDWLDLFGPKCAAWDCGKPVAESLTGNGVVALGKDWHKNCFVCKNCNLILDETTFYELDREPFCYSCYHDRTCVDCLKVKEEKAVQLKKIVPVTRTLSHSSRRSISPLNFLRRTKSNQP